MSPSRQQSLLGSCGSGAIGAAINLFEGEKYSMSTQWKMSCPKCGSINVDLEEDQRAFVGGGRHQVQLHCYTCGKVIYGEENIQAECNRQYRLWEADQANFSSETARPRKARAPVDAPSPAASAPSAAAIETPAPAAATPVADAAVAAAPAAAAPAKVADDAGGGNMCTWRECNNVARPNSKYCSRNCSNKNARARYSKRKKPE